MSTDPRIAEWLVGTNSDQAGTENVLAELDSAPPELIRQLSAHALREFTVALRADRNRYRNMLRRNR